MREPGGYAIPVAFRRALTDMLRVYRAEARRSLLTIGGTLDEATGIVRPFADPLLERTAAGQWEPATGRWSG